MKPHTRLGPSTAIDDLTLAMEPDAIRELGYRIVDMITEEFAEPTNRPLFPPEQSYDAMEALFGGPLPRQGMDPEALLETVQEHLLPAAGNPNHPGLMAYVLTASTPFAALMEALVAAIKLRPTTWKNQPASCHIEATVVRWLGQMVGFAENAAGYITTGGSWANLVGLAAARVRQADWDIRAEGVANRPPLVAYVSAEAHSCIDRSAELLGLGGQYLRKIPVDAEFRMRLDLLEATLHDDLAAGHLPFCVIGNAGTVNTGAIDPLPELADLAEQYGLWFHVDGAYGAFATLAPEARSLFAGIEQADSLTLDPHKWLNTPFEGGCILTKRWEDLGDTFSLIPPYLRGAMGEEHNQYEYGFELSRTDRALKVWLVLQQYGADHYAELVAQHLALARHLAALVDEADDFELVSAPVLSICCFRFVPPELKDYTAEATAYLNDLNHAIEMALASDGRALVSGTDLNGIRVMRACIASHPATQASVEEAFTLLQHYGRKLHAERRGARA
jgi:glutamate/tyrosine decarboxylase-like PLP-dependent enzyme